MALLRAYHPAVFKVKRLTKLQEERLSTEAHTSRLGRLFDWGRLLDWWLPLHPDPPGTWAGSFHHPHQPLHILGCCAALWTSLYSYRVPPQIAWDATWCSKPRPSSRSKLRGKRTSCQPTSHATNTCCLGRGAKQGIIRFRITCVWMVVTAGVTPATGACAIRLGHLKSPILAKQSGRIATRSATALRLAMCGTMAARCERRWRCCPAISWRVECSTTGHCFNNTSRERGLLRFTQRGLHPRHPWPALCGLTETYP